MPARHCSRLFFFFNDTATTEIYTLPLHDALPICRPALQATSLRFSSNRPRPKRSIFRPSRPRRSRCTESTSRGRRIINWRMGRSEEHTSELQSQSNLVCRLLLEKKKTPHTPSVTDMPVGHHLLRLRLHRGPTLVYAASAAALSACFLSSLERAPVSISPASRHNH